MPSRVAAAVLAGGVAACAASDRGHVEGERAVPASTSVAARAAAPPSAAAAAPAGATSALDAPSPSSSASAPTASSPAAPAPARRYAVAAMGDSLTDPRSQGGKYLDVLRRACPESHFDSYGVGGNMVNQMRKRLLPEVFGEGEGGRRVADPPKKYTHLLVLGGINDIISDESALRVNAKIQRDLAWMYEAARARGVEVIAMTLPPWGGLKGWHNPRRQASTEAMNTWIRGAQARGDVDAVFDVYPLMSCGRPDFLCDDYAWPDGAHWTKKGHEVMGTALHAAHFADCR
ncbi:MAG: SGNH/GDSL hydrolase family protein [Myxococcota bacterium]